MIFRTRLSLAELITTWQHAGQAVTPAQVQAALKLQLIPTPWYVQALVGLGAWFAAILLILFMLFSLLIYNESVLIVIGLFGIASAIVLFRVSAGINNVLTVFLQQLALVVSIFGVIALLIGVGVQARSLQTVALVAILAELVIYILSPYSIRRFLSVLVIPHALLMLMYSHSTLEFRIQQVPHQIVFIALLVAILYVWVYSSKLETKTWGKPLKYGLVIALLGMLWVTLIRDHANLGWSRTAVDYRLWWPTTLVAAIALGALADQALRRLPGANPAFAWFGMALIGVVAVLTYHSPGVVISLFVIVLAYTYGSRALLSVALVFLAIFMSAYYYYLGVSLLYKSIALMSTGVLFLGSAWIVTRLQSTAVVEGE